MGVKIQELQPVVKRFIVRAVAQYDTPTTVVRKVAEEFGIKIGATNVLRYDPTRPNGKVFRRNCANCSTPTESIFWKTLRLFPSPIGQSV